MSANKNFVFAMICREINEEKIALWLRSGIWCVRGLYNFNISLFSGEEINEFRVR